jgi:hypothetical protein
VFIAGLVFGLYVSDMLIANKHLERQREEQRDESLGLWHAQALSSVRSRSSMAVSA